MNRILFAGLSSGSGKTAVTCACLRALQKKGISAASFKCGPDYIDPMFHQRVLGIPGENLDLFFADAKTLQRQIACYEQRCKIAVLEGVMGYYDGLGGVSDRDSTWDVACATNTPVILVVRPKGASLTIAAQVQGMLSFRKRNQLAGILLNGCSERMARLLAPMLEEQTGLPVVGFLPYVEDASFESRHLGLVTAQEVGALSEKVDRLADAFLQHVDLEQVLRIAATADSVGENTEQKDNTVTAKGAEKAGAPTDRAAASWAADVAEPARQNRSTACNFPFPPPGGFESALHRTQHFVFIMKKTKGRCGNRDWSLWNFRRWKIKSCRKASADCIWAADTRSCTPGSFLKTVGCVMQFLRRSVMECRRLRNAAASCICKRNWKTLTDRSGR